MSNEYSSEDYRQRALDSFYAAVEASCQPITIEHIKRSKTLPKIHDPKKTDEEFIRFFQNEVRPAILDCIRKDGESLESTSNRLTSIHSEYLNNRDLDPIENTFTVSSTEYTSRQEFLTKVDSTASKTAKSCCYVRDRYGLPGLRKQTLTEKKSGEILLELYHHGSPVPIKIKDFKTRIEITKLNFDQLHLNVGEDKPITEIRLLSPLKIPYRWIERFISNQKQYDQILETYLAMLLNNKETRMFVYGVNQGRAYFDDLQTFINTRSTNDLLIDYFFDCFGKSEFLESTFKKEFIKLKDDLNRHREELFVDISKLYKQENLSESSFKSKLHDLLKEHHEIELNCSAYLLEQYSKLKKLSNTSGHKNPIDSDIQMALKLMNNNNWTKPEHNYQLQATLARIESQLGRKVATGCNDGKDRSNRVGLTREAEEAFKKRYEYYPNPFDKAHQKLLKVIQTQVYNESSPRFAAEAVSIPGANHLEIHAKDGNEHLNANKKIAHLFKNMHKLPKKYKILDTLQAEKEKEESTKGNWLVATIVGFVFVTFAALFGSPELAMASSSYDSQSKTMSSKSNSDPIPYGSKSTKDDMTLPSAARQTSRRSSESNNSTDAVDGRNEEGMSSSNSKTPPSGSKSPREESLIIGERNLKPGSSKRSQQDDSDDALDSNNREEKKPDPASNLEAIVTSKTSDTTLEAININVNKDNPVRNAKKQCRSSSEFFGEPRLKIQEEHLQAPTARSLERAR